MKQIGLQVIHVDYVASHGTYLNPSIPPSTALTPSPLQQPTNVCVSKLI